MLVGANAKDRKTVANIAIVNTVILDQLIISIKILATFQTRLARIDTRVGNRQGNIDNRNGNNGNGNNKHENNENGGNETCGNGNHNNHNNKSYCHMHSCTHRDNHTSTTCDNLKEGHVASVTLANRQGEVSTAVKIPIDLDIFIFTTNLVVSPNQSTGSAIIANMG